MKKLAIILFFFSFLLFFSSFLFYYLNNSPLEERVIYASANLTDISGFDVSSAALTFGNIVNGSSSSRNIIFNNRYKFPLTVLIKVDGSISQLLYFEEKLIIDSGDTARVPFTAFAADNLERGFYSGNVSFLIFERKGI